MGMKQGKRRKQKEEKNQKKKQETETVSTRAQLSMSALTASDTEWPQPVSHALTALQNLFPPLTS